jgi:hypothetical protein
LAVDLQHFDTELDNLVVWLLDLETLVGRLWVLASNGLIGRKPKERGSGSPPQSPTLTL